MGKLLRGTLYAAGLAAALAAFGWFFVSQLSTGSGRSGELAGVLLAPPPDFAVVERGEMAPATAAAELEVQVLRSGTGKVGVRFKRQGDDVYWLADPAADLLEERAAGASGTRLQTTWKGEIRRRLSWARTHGSFDAPGLPAAERKNLYH
jgi:hypothetical protein